ncbi:MAG TPA: hypothetical protein VES20_07435 [Bryobacteraceae bacterium]|nr:hypothetical protein [Bryobacteraceae bacterium]
MVRILITGLAAALLISAQQADTISYKGRIVTVAASQPVAQAVAIRGNRFLVVGQMYSYSDPDYRGVLALTRENLLQGRGLQTSWAGK